MERAEETPEVASAPAAHTRRPAKPRRVTISAGNGIDFDVETESDEPIIVEEGIFKADDGRGPAQYTIVKQGDKILMKIHRPLINWFE